MSRSKPSGGLRQRVLTAVLLLVPVVGASFTHWWPLVPAVFVLLGAWEWCALAGLQDTRARALYLLALVLPAGAFVLGPGQAPGSAWIGGLALLWWVWMLADLVRTGASPSGLFASLPGRLLAGALVLWPTWLACVELRTIDPLRPALLLYLLGLVWAADSSAYFMGRQWGKRKLAPMISPGKTVEGLVGAAGAVVVLSYVCGKMVWQFNGYALILWIGLALLTLGFSVVGDLVQSKLKRIAGAKDSGTWLPGHGGVLDRIDALTAAAPVFLLGWIMFVTVRL